MIEKLNDLLIADLPRVPLLLIHGWPGSVYEFYSAIPLLLQKAENSGFTYDIVVPSLPGYGFSEPCAKPGNLPLLFCIV